MLLVSLLLAAAVHAAPPTAKAPPPLAGPVELRAQAARQHGAIGAFPLVLPGPAATPAVAARINAALQRDQKKAEAAAADCRSGFREAQGKPADPDAWERSVEVTMRGPRYLALMVTDSYYCGGPYPNFGLETPLVYDLATGAPVNWIKLFPPGVTAELATSPDGSKAGWAVWPELTRRARAAAEPDCKDVFDGETGRRFQISLDARAGELHATPADFPHAFQACADAVVFGLAELRRMKFAPELIEALDAARKAQR